MTCSHISFILSHAGSMDRLTYIHSPVMCFRVIVEVQDGSHAEVGPLQCGASRLRHVALDDFL